MKTDAGEVVTTRFRLMATGALSAALTPNFEGLDTFRGDIYHTAHWPHGRVDFTSRRVAVIGTGSSGIQSIPIIAQPADQLCVFQRTPNYSVPDRNKALTRAEMAEVKANYEERRQLSWHSGGGSPYIGTARKTMELPPQERRAAFEKRWQLHVKLVRVRRTPIVSVDATAIYTTDAHYDLDAIVLATGFDAMTGALANRHRRAGR